MYLIILLSGSIVSTIASLLSRNKKDLGVLALILWGATIMFVVDKTYAYIEDHEPFIDNSIDSLMLGFTLLATGLIIWSFYIATRRLRRKTH